MDRKVVVLSPNEWENRVTLNKSVQQAINHNHFALTKSNSVQAILYGIKLDVLDKKFDTLEEDIAKAIDLLTKVDNEIRLSQEILGGINVVIK